MRKIFFFLSFFLSFHSYSQQKIQFNVKLLASDNRDLSQWLFRVKLVNKGFEKYWIQDTTYLAKWVGTPALNLIHPIIWKKKGDKYANYEKPFIRSGMLRDKCMDSCCNCIFVPVHDSVSFDIKLFAPYKFDKGQYKMQLYLSIPLESCNGCVQLPELESNYLFFTVK